MKLVTPLRAGRSLVSGGISLGRLSGAAVWDELVRKQTEDISTSVAKGSCKMR